MLAYKRGNMDWIQFFILFVTLIGFLWSSKTEMKDFHGRLCRLEEKYQQMMERWLESRK
jgi:hypothetical protein